MWESHSNERRNPGMSAAASSPKASPSLPFRTTFAKYKVIGIVQLMKNNPASNTGKCELPKKKHTNTAKSNATSVLTMPMARAIHPPVILPSIEMAPISKMIKEFFSTPEENVSPISERPMTNAMSAMMKRNTSIAEKCRHFASLM